MSKSIWQKTLWYTSGPNIHYVDAKLPVLRTHFITGLAMTVKSVPKNLLHSPHYQLVSICLLVMSPCFTSSRSFTALICFLIIIFCLESILGSWPWTFLWNFMKVPMYMKKKTLNKGFALLLFTYISVHFIMIPRYRTSDTT